MVLSEKIISKHIIKPSFPTPNRFKNHKLSFFDQIQPLLYDSPIFFYQDVVSKDKQHAEISQMLKHSLSKTLTSFYPLAGTLQGNSSIDCNDTGVEFTETQVHARLHQIIEEPKLEELKQLAPMDILSHDNNILLSVKISFFECGGIAIGVGISHKIVDFESAVMFMNVWATTCRGETQVIQPFLHLANYFPSKEVPSFPCLASDKTITKRLVFDGEKLEKLRQDAAFGEVKNPSRVEALTAFIVQSVFEATKLKSDIEKRSYHISHAMNLRSRLIPSIPDHSFGNCSYGAGAFVNENSDLISKLRVAISAVDDDHIKKMINNEDYYHSRKNNDEDNLLETIHFVSVWKFPIYDIDFGWGKPIWICFSEFPINNMVMLMSTPSKNGIEAWVTMTDDVLQILENNYHKLLQ